MNRASAGAADLDRIAEAISDGRPVEWPSQGHAPEPVARAIESLRLIESVAAAHRSLPPAAAKEATAVPARVSSHPAMEPAATGTLDLPLPAPTQETAALTESSSTLPVPAAPGPGIWGRLQIRERLGSGSFGEVYRAWDPKLQVDVALKLLRAGDTDRREQGRFIDEARRLARVRHDNVVVVHGADEHDGRVGIWTDLLRGSTLEQWLAEHGAFSAREATSIGIELCHALSAIHAKGLVHRDVKTDNIMRDQGGRYVLTDFGTVVERRPDDSSHAAQPIAGTPLYMAPEILDGNPATTAADLYALGVVLYRLVTRRFPIEAKTLRELREAHKADGLTPLSDLRSDLPAAFVEVIERAIAKNPAERFASAGVMERALRVANGETPPRDDRRFERASRITRGAWILAIAAVLVVAGALAIGLGLRGRSPAIIPDAASKPDVGLFRRTANGPSERLADGGKVSVGDKLFVEVESASEVFLYVLNQDRMGHVFVLFPDGGDLRNPLPGRDRHHLPGYGRDGRPQDWLVDSTGGTEDFLIIADTRPRGDIERYIAALPRPRPGGQAEGLASAAPELDEGNSMGVGSLAPAAEPGAGEDHLLALSRLATSRSEGRGAPWIWRFRLANPPVP